MWKGQFFLQYQKLTHNSHNAQSDNQTTISRNQGFVFAKR